MLEGLSSVFEKLPAPLQIALALGVAIAGAFIAIQKLTTKNGGANQIHPLALDLAKTAAELADAKLRSDLVQVVESTRVGIENRVERGLGELRAGLIAAEQQAKQDRHELRNRMLEQAQSFDRTIELLEDRIRRLERRDE